MSWSGGFYDDCQLVQDYRMINWYSNKEHQVETSMFEMIIDNGMIVFRGNWRRCPRRWWLVSFDNDSLPFD